MAPSRDIWRGAPRPLIVAHRGASRAAPENTLAAFRTAVDLGADGVEFDVQRTADGALVVFHDATLERTTNGRGPLRETRLADLKALDAGGWFSASSAGERIPTLEETIAVLPAPVRVFVELKQGPVFDEGIVAALADGLRHADVTGRCEVSSFDHPSLKRFTAASPDVPTGILFSARLIDPVAAATLAGAAALHPEWDLIAPDLVPLAHSHGLAVVGWTVNAADQMERLAAMEVDAIITDLPDLARRVLGR
ncbi:MAG TPA: glycerophosphodiester phosphodiesterase family protein [bacterium]|jgi:glycerophosphoryl diester phosphodiesterase|nr:glycerophosphodiester phosphodiesterase family protein [bacterium]